MITKTEIYGTPAFEFPDRYSTFGKPVIFDIETTGFSPESSFTYLIGVLFPEENNWKMTQWLSETPEDEKELLTSFFYFMKDFQVLVHFNGDAFDLPYLMKRCTALELPFFPENLQSIDLYRTFRPLKKLLKLSAMNLKSLEEFLSVSRKDTMDGGKLISVYHQFAQTGAYDLQEILLLHNHDDLLGTASLFSLFSYSDLLDGKFELSGVSQMEEDENSFQLLLSLTLKTPVPKQISVPLEHGYLTACGSSCRMSIHGFRGNLKYFFNDYKNYYYLPLEDTAIHKSVASYVDREHRVPAKASTCYCRKNGCFLPVYDTAVTPLFKKDYKDVSYLMECTPEFLSDTRALEQYLSGLLKHV